MSYSENPDVAQFLVSDVCKAAGITPATFRNWTRGAAPAVLLTKEDRTAAETGSLNLLSWRRVLQTSIVAHIVDRYGMPPRKAALIAVAFTDTSSSSHWEGDQPPRSRLPGELFPAGLTILMSMPQGLGRTVNVLPKGPGGPPLLDALLEADSSGVSTLIVNVNAINAQVRSALGLDMDWGRSDFERGVPALGAKMPDAAANPWDAAAQGNNK